MKKEETIQAVRKYLDSDDWHYEFLAEKGWIKFNLNVKCKMKKLKYAIDFRDDCYLVYAFSPVNADKDNLGEMLSYLTQANYGLRNGNFEMDVHDGEVRYKIFVNTDDLPKLCDTVIKDSIYMPAVMFERYGDGIAALAMGFSDADTEIKKAQQ